MYRKIMGFLQAWKNLDSRQIYFVNQIVEYIIHNGVMKDLSVLQEPPFTVRGSIDIRRSVMEIVYSYISN